MRIAARLGVALGIALSLAACEGTRLSRLNPLGLFGSSREVAGLGPDAPPGRVVLRADDPRGLVDQVTGLSVEPMPGGAVVRASGLPPVQGFWDADLVPAADGPVGGVLFYDLRVAPPPALRRVGPPASREVVTAAFVPDALLRDVAAIRVRGVRNAREARR